MVDMADAVHTQQTNNWIISRDADLAVYFGGPLLALLVAALVIAEPRLLAPLFVGWLLCIEGPHLLVMYLRVFHAGAQAPVYYSTLRRSWLCFAPPLMIWFATQAADVPAVMEILLGVGVLYSWYHLNRQHHGILVIYQTQTASGDSVLRRPIQQRECRDLQTWLWSIFLLSAFIAPAYRSNFDNAPGGPLLWKVLELALALFSAGVVLRLIWQGVLRHRSGLDMRPWWFAIAIALYSGVALLGVGALEPLQPNATGYEQLMMTVTLMTGIVHGAQYIGIVLVTNWRRNVTHPHKQGWSVRLAHAPAIAFLLMVAVSALYVVLNGVRGVLPNPAWFHPDSGIAQFATALYWGFFFQHYYIDSKIWRVGQDAALRTELGLMPVTGARA